MNDVQNYDGPLPNRGMHPAMGEWSATARTLAHRVPRDVLISAAHLHVLGVCVKNRYGPPCGAVSPSSYTTEGAVGAGKALSVASRLVEAGGRRLNRREVQRILERAADIIALDIIADGARRARQVGEK